MHDFGAVWLIATDVGAQNELAIEAARFETVVRLGVLVERDALRDAWPDGVGRQRREEPPQVLTEPGGIPHPHCIESNRRG